MKLFTTTSLLSLGFLIMTAPCFAADQASELTGKNLITGDVVTVGDLFTNAGGSAGHVLAPAPAIGSPLALSAADLDRVAKTFRLNWENKIDSGITLERDAIAIDKDKIIASLNNSELKGKIDAGAELQLSNIQDDIIVSGHDDTDLTVSDVRFDGTSKKFSAVLNIARNDKILKQVSVEGTASIMVHVPVVKFSMTYNTLISDKDIGDIVVPQTQLRGDAIMSKADLIGMTAKRTILANQVITQQDVTPPVMVKRNDIVTIIYKSGSIQLSSKARSLGNGSRGDNVQFMNTTSKKAFDAKVTGPQTAEVNLDG